MPDRRRLGHHEAGNRNQGLLVIGDRIGLIGVTGGDIDDRSGGHVGGDNRDILFQPTSGNPRDWSNLMLESP